MDSLPPVVKRHWPLAGAALLFGLYGWALLAATASGHDGVIGPRFNAPGADWVIFLAAARAFFTHDLAHIYDQLWITQAVNSQFAHWLSGPEPFPLFPYPPVYLLLVLPFVAAGCGLLALTGRGLDALSLGEAQAQSLGVDPRRLAALTVAGTALAVGAVTSVTGAIGFIGLVAPHLVRPLVDYAPRKVLLPAALAGAVLLLGSDIAARLIHTNPELRLGVFTSLLGTPFFFWLVVRIRKVAP